jgi:hypothetical protein
MCDQNPELRPSAEEILKHKVKENDIKWLVDNAIFWGALEVWDEYVYHPVDER